MAELKHLQNRMIKGIGKLCASWVNPGVTDPNERRQDAALIGAMFALPLVSTGSVLLQQAVPFHMETIIPRLSLAYAAPMLAAGLLSMTGNAVWRRILSLAVLPSFCLAVTQGHIWQFESMLLAGVLAGTGLRLKLIDKPALLAGSALAALTALPAGLSAFVGAMLLGATSFAVSMFGAPVATTSTSQAHDVEKSEPDESQLLALLTGPDMIVLRSDRSGNILFAQGLDAHVARLSEIIHISDQLKVLTSLDGVCAAIAPAHTVEAKIRKPHGHGAGYRYENARISMVASNNEVLAAIRFEAEGSAKDMQGVTALEQASHELRTPLNAIVGFSEVLEDGLLGDLANERQREYVELINRSGRHMLEVIGSILDVASLGNGSKSVASAPFLPDEIASFAIKMLARHAEARRIGLDYMPACVFEAFVGDRRICMQIMTNLLSNAIKYTPEGGLVRLHVDINANGLVIEVKDNGIGMTGNELARAGSPFFRAEGADMDNGTGLGLALVRKLAEHHGGAMEIESEPGKGTRVRVTLVENRRISETPAAISVLRPQTENESARIISISEEPYDAAPRKTA